MSWPARAVFVLLVGATFGAFFAAQRLKSSPPIVSVRGLATYYSPAAPGHAANDFSVTVKKADDVTVDVVDAAGEPVRTLVDARRRRAYQPLQLSWNGRTDAGRIPPDGVYRVRVSLRAQGRSVVVPKAIFLDTTPPAPSVEAIDHPIVAPGEPVKIELKGVGPRARPSVRILRTDGAGAPREVATLARKDGSLFGRGQHTVRWDGLVGARPAAAGAPVAAGTPAPPGTYVVQVSVADKAGNVGIVPALPLQAGQIHGVPGITVRTLGVQAPARTVTEGDTFTVNVDARDQTYHWQLRRVGRSRPVADGRGSGHELQVRAPQDGSGLYLLEVRVGAARAQAPVLVTAKAPHDLLVVVPQLTWLGSATGDQDRDGLPNALANGSPVSWPRVTTALPAELTRDVAPLLVFLDRAHIAYDLAGDLDLALSGAPRPGERRGVLLAGSERWITSSYGRRLRRFAVDGGRVASIGAGTLRRGVALQRNEQGTAGRLTRPTQPTEQDPFGARLLPVTRAVRQGAAPLPLTPIGGSAGHPLLQSVTQLDGFDALEESLAPAEPGARVLAALGQDLTALEPAPATGDAGTPAQPPELRPAVTATKVGKGLVLRIGLAQWSQRLGDPQVAQLTRNAVDLLRGTQPKPRGLR